MKSASEVSYYLPTDAPDVVLATPATAGPWSPKAQHGGPPSGLLTRAIEALLWPGSPSTCLDRCPSAGSG